MMTAMDRYYKAQAECATGPDMFTAAFLGSLSVGYDEHGRTDPEAWDRAIRNATKATNRQAAERLATITTRRAA